MSFVERFLILCPYLGGSTIIGSTVLLYRGHRSYDIQNEYCYKKDTERVRHHQPASVHQLPLQGYGVLSTRECVHAGERATKS